MRESYRIMYEAYERIFDRFGLDYGDRRGGPGADRRRRQPRVHGACERRRGPVRRVRERRLPRRHRGRPAAGARARRRKGRSRSPRSTRPTRRRSSRWRRCWTSMPSQTLKCVMFDVAGTTTAVLVPGDREVNVDKLEQLVFPAKVRPFDDEDFGARGFVKGYVGPQGFDDDVQVFADLTVRGGNDWVTGSEHEVDRHVTGANVGPRLPRGPLGGPGRVPRRRSRVPIDGGELHIGACRSWSATSTSWGRSTRRRSTRRSWRRTTPGGRT